MANVEDLICYENLDHDLSKLKPIEWPCILAGMLTDRLGMLSIQAEHREDKLFTEQAAWSIRITVDLLQRLFLSLDDASILLELEEIHAHEGRKVGVSGRWYRCYCEAAREIGREFYCAIYKASDGHAYTGWFLADMQNPQGYEQLPDATIETHWPDIARAILDVPKVDFDELDLGIRDELIEVRGTNPDPPSNRTAAPTKADGGDDGDTDMINARMLDKLSRDTDCYGWTVEKWKVFLGCAKSTIHGKPAWKLIMAHREAAKDEYS